MSLQSIDEEQIDLHVTPFTSVIFVGDSANNGCQEPCSKSYQVCMIDDYNKELSKNYLQDGLK